MDYRQMKLFIIIIRVIRVIRTRIGLVKIWIQFEGQHDAKPPPGGRIMGGLGG